MSDLPKRKLRWFQFRLRTLLIFVTFVGVFCGLFVLPAIKQRRLVAELQSLGAGVEYDDETLPFPLRLLDPNWLDRLAGYDFCHRATGVWCGSDSQMGKLLQTAAQLPHLESLGLDGCDLTDGDLAEIGRCATLRELRIGLYATDSIGSVMRDWRREKLLNSHLTAAALSSLENLTALETLSLAYRTCPTDAGLAHLEKLKELRSLDLEETSVSSAGLRHLTGLTHLQTLSLAETNVTDDGLVHLEPLQALRSLDLQGTPVSSAGLPHLKWLTHLKELDLDYTNVTDEGVADLRRALPNCRISHFY